MSFKKRLLTVLYAWLFTMFATQVMAEQAQTLQDPQLATLLKKRMQESQAPALSVAVVMRDQTQQYIMGLADIESNAPNTAETVFELASLSKSFTGLAIQLLISQGKLRLDDDIKTFLPTLDLRYQDQPVRLTVADFLFHTSGMPLSSLAKIGSLPPGDIEQVVNAISHESLDFFPGSRFVYVTTNYDILGRVIEKISGKSYAGFIHDNIFQLLQMNHSDVIGFASQNQHKASGYKLAFGQPARFEDPANPGHAPAAYINATLGDMQTWLAAQLMFTDLNAQLQQSIMTTWRGNDAVPLASDNRTLYGSGWFVDYDVSPYIHHIGANPSFSSCIAFRPEQGWGVVALANINSNVINELCNDVDNYLRVKYYDEYHNDLFHVIDQLFTLLICLLVILTGLFFVRTIYRQIMIRRRYGISFICYMLSFWQLIGLLLVMSVLAIILYLLPGLVVPGITWQFLWLWGPGSLYSGVVAAIGLIVLLLINHFANKNYAYIKLGGRDE